MQRLKRHFDPDGVLNIGRDLVSASLLQAGAERRSGDTVESEDLDAD